MMSDDLLDRPKFKSYLRQSKIRIYFTGKDQTKNGNYKPELAHLKT